MYFDLNGQELWEYRSAQQAPEDFAEFWSDTLAESRRFDAPTTVLRHDSPLRTVDVYDVRFPGYLGQQIDRVAARSSRKQRAPRNNRRARRVRRRARPGRGRDLLGVVRFRSPAHRLPRSGLDLEPGRHA